jgi:hypothetical protein
LTTKVHNRDIFNRFYFEEGTITQNLFHQEFNPPPEGSHTGLNRVETVDPVKDQSNDMEQIQHRFVCSQTYS